jgi:hypothetical protein
MEEGEVRDPPAVAPLVRSWWSFAFSAAVTGVLARSPCCCRASCLLFRCPVPSGLRALAAAPC